jgi:hypothetical protein
MHPAFLSRARRRVVGTLPTMGVAAVCPPANEFTLGIKLSSRVSDDPAPRRSPVGRTASCTLPAVVDPEQDESLVDRLSRQGEEALGKVAEELIANPVVNGALTRAFEAREKAVQAQEAAMGALNIPSAADIERITRRLRSLSHRLEGIEDAVDRVEARFAEATADPADERWAAIQERLEELARDLAAVREVVAPGEEAPPRAQERLTVTDS